jgi:hypothetical protein
MSRILTETKILVIPEDPVFGPWYYLSFKKFFLKVVPGTKCSLKIFQKFFSSKNNVHFFNFFSPISWGLCTGTECEKVNF